MILYPTTVIFQVTKTIGKALHQLKEGKPMAASQGVNMNQFMEIVDLPFWKAIEEEFEGKAI